MKKIIIILLGILLNVYAVLAMHQEIAKPAHDNLFSEIEKNVDEYSRNAPERTAASLNDQQIKRLKELAHNKNVLIELDKTAAPDLQKKIQELQETIDSHLGVGRGFTRGGEVIEQALKQSVDLQQELQKYRGGMQEAFEPLQKVELDGIKPEDILKNYKNLSSEEKIEKYKTIVEAMGKLGEGDTPTFNQYEAVLLKIEHDSNIIKELRQAQQDSELKSQLEKIKERRTAKNKKQLTTAEEWEIAWKKNIVLPLQRLFGRHEAALKTAKAIAEIHKDVADTIEHLKAEIKTVEVASKLENKAVAAYENLEKIMQQTSKLDAESKREIGKALLNLMKVQADSTAELSKQYDRMDAYQQRVQETAGEHLLKLTTVLVNNLEYPMQELLNYVDTLKFGRLEEAGEIYPGHSMLEGEKLRDVLKGKTIESTLPKLPEFFRRERDEAEQQKYEKKLQEARTAVDALTGDQKNLIFAYRKTLRQYEAQIKKQEILKTLPELPEIPDPEDPEGIHVVYEEEKLNQDKERLKKARETFKALTEEQKDLMGAYKFQLEKREKDLEPWAKAFETQVPLPQTR